MNRGRSVQSLHTGTPEAFEMLTKVLVLRTWWLSKILVRKRARLFLLYFITLSDASLQCNHLPLSLKSCVILASPSTREVMGGKNKGRVYIRCCFLYPVTFLFLEKYTTHSQKFPAGSPHGLDFETLIRDTLGPALFSLLYSVEASGNKLVKTGETVGFTNTAAA